MKYRLAGAILGDIAGSSYEFVNKTKNYDAVNIYSKINTFTDDTVCTIAIADAILNPIGDNLFDFTRYLKKWCRKYPDVGYGPRFKNWFLSDNFYLNQSFGNGSAMRVSPIGFYAKDVVECRILAQLSCMNSHCHFEGIRGAQAIAECIFKMYNNDEKLYNIGNILGEYYKEWYKYYQDGNALDKIRPDYSFKVSCQESVPVAILSFEESTSYEDCIKKAISMGGDSDTLAAMAGGIAYSYFKEMTPESITFFENTITDEMLEIVEKFDKLIDERDKNR